MGGPGEDPDLGVREALERLLLDGPRRYTRLDVGRMAGMPPERTQRLWRALGFPDAADDDPAFTDADIAALGVLSTLIDSGFVDAGSEASIARAMGQSLSRLADWQTDMLADALLRGARADEDPAATTERAVAAAQALLPRLRAVQDYVWRRHLVANVDRLLAATGPGDRRELAVGFADLVGYTSRSRGMGGRELGAMVEDFESTAAEVIARHHGRVVKTVGDGVLFTARSATDAADIGLELPDAWAADDRPPLRVGAAYGAVLTRLGDVYSPVVNLASRLTSLARPRALLVDRDLADRLRPLEGYRVRPLRRVSVRGYDHLQPWLVRRARAAAEDPGSGYDEDAFDVADDPPAGRD
ncbi:adenylate/guanylate cyclase domain-containing protein [Blastococcus sp. MG754426]|uniref:adenylate/guanylate cyclase domain-containing protein n=1 Tax=unclassified Blastococcus TaxID=2619396 RepID=UPI001EEF955E|nr:MULTISPECIES: adenylate/guanylate cyclase domain-containing protein [unclassified Blastococcus]MCF6505984.1 adenylate/guanylate cyclase domain-containing protein [Blastococcus sp. MG754426]MCF6510630.1 adenylate/guanylate cyclase domain-containing protein [Blastococcus sp. MG754427]MCF6737352.1 adenylate/guanylate cyclase domain-containing protein [Blastococcus sp. KM273129]